MNRAANSGLSGRTREIIFLLTLAGLALLIYSNVLHGPFLFDDKDNIPRNIFIRIDELSIEKLWAAGFDSPSPNRPFANISFALNFFIHGYDTFGYHLVNVFIHILTGIFLYFFIKNTLVLSYDYYKGPGNANSSAVAFFIALIWLVHPIQTQSVSYMVQRMTSMAGLFYVLSMLLYVRGRLAGRGLKKWILFCGSMLSGILAMGSKEIAVTLPVFIILYEWYFFQDLRFSWLKRQVVPLLAVLIIVILLGGIYFRGIPLMEMLSGYDTREFTLIERVLTEFRVVVYYISLLLFPYYARLNLDYSFPISHSFIDPPTTVLSILIIASLAALSILLARKDRLISFGILWFLGNLVLESSVVGLELVYEHRLYIPSMLFVAAVVILAARFVKPNRALIALLCCISAVFSLWTFQRNMLWADEFSLWQDCVKKSPDKARPHNNLGLAFYDRGMIEEAVREYDRALQLDPTYILAVNNKGVALNAQGKGTEAVDLYVEALKRFPNSSETYANLGAALMLLGRFDEAVNSYEKAIQLKPGNHDAYNSLGMAMARKGNVNKAVACYRQALHINPYSTDACINLGLAFANKGDIPGAVAYFSQAIKINPMNVKALSNLGLAMAKQGRAQDARRYYSSALRIDPQYPDANRGLGDLSFSSGKFQEAIGYYKKALQSDQGNIALQERLSIAFKQIGEYESALNCLLKIKDLQPGNAGVYYNISCIYSLQGKVVDSTAWLKEALARGFNDVDLLSTDADLENVRKTKQFQEIKSKLSLPVHQGKGYL